jgi:hypothetical protein
VGSVRNQSATTQAEKLTAMTAMLSVTRTSRRARIDCTTCIQSPIDATPKPSMI